MSDFLVFAEFSNNDVRIKMVALSFEGFRGKSRKLRILVRKEPNLKRGKATESQSKRED